MSAKSEISLKNFYVYNDSYGQKEGEEHKKILYYYPPGTDNHGQMMSVGLSEAIIKFTETFNPDKPCETLHTQKTKQYYHTPEKHFWMVLTLNIPHVTKTKDGVEYVEYHSDDVQDNVYLAILQHAYQIFRLFKGTFNSILDGNEGNVEVLKSTLDRFFFRYMITLKVNHCDVLDIFQGVQILPLTKALVLRCKVVLHRLRSLFPNVKYMVLLYNEHMLWSDIQPDDMKVLYSYVVYKLMPSHIEAELQAESMSRHAALNLHFGRFIIGPSNLSDPDATVPELPRVHIHHETAPEELNLVVYRAYSASVCLLVDDTVPLNMEFFKHIDVFLSLRIAGLAYDVDGIRASLASTSSASALQQASNPKFVYYNPLNNIYRSSVHLDTRKTGNIIVPCEVVRLLADIHADKERLPVSGETIVKTMTDYWIVAKFAHLREFYALTQQKNTNLVGIDEEIKKFFADELSKIFIIPNVLCYGD